ncbi:MAG TPA: DinB family protein [Thermoanaerobaculia bacterium]|nr:DinB family protein [Thermoanaerobaculia bacterium]
MKQKRPAPTDHAPNFSRYIDLVPEEDILGAMEKQSAETQKVLAKVDQSRGDYRYGPDKWSVKEVVGHIEDAERVFAYRALTFARAGTTALPGFDESSWMVNAPFASTTLRHRAESLALVRQTTLRLFRDLKDEAWDRAGISNDHNITVRALAYIIVGHERHHLKMLRERYAIGT